ncbi:hypothetical protein AM394_24470 [Klebsiella oxytoca]|nr:hypothetical protein AM394_24470 [Klebsiella oxytoca]MBX4821404.1 hypothetical protein [Klebsiella michiganensis]QET50437.1 hypothetical protein FOB55_21480 [Klebsiella michiganensis]
MVKSLSVMGITDSDFPMSSITGRANLLLTTSIGGGVHAGIKKAHLTMRPCTSSQTPVGKSISLPRLSALYLHGNPVL